MRNSRYEALARELDGLQLHSMAAKARVGYYSDFDSPLALPKMQLVGELREIGTDGALALVEKVITGEYDG